jgi:hypothetical protein
MFRDKNSDFMLAGEAAPEVPVGGEAEVEKNDWQKYQELGGIIDEPGYASAMERANDSYEIDENKVKRIRAIAYAAEIELTPQAVKLFSILRGDEKPSGVEHHHSQMTDEKLLIQVLLILGDKELADKIIPVAVIPEHKQYQFNEDAQEQRKKVVPSEYPKE